MQHTRTRPGSAQLLCYSAYCSDLAPHVRYGGSDTAVFSLKMECGGWFKPQQHIVIVAVQSRSSVRNHAQVGLVL